jgi:Tfp pilus assembly protein FimT
MNMLISFPGGSEIMVIIVLLLILVCMPVTALYYYFKSQRLANELERLKEERHKLRNTGSEITNHNWAAERV